MPLVSASNENQAKYCALMFLGVSLKIAGRRPAIFQIEYFKKGNLLQIYPWLVLQKKYAMWDILWSKYPLIFIQVKIVQ